MKTTLTSLVLAILVSGCAFGDTAKTVTAEKDSGVLMWPTNLWAVESARILAALRVDSSTNTISTNQIPVVDLMDFLQPLDAALTALVADPTMYQATNGVLTTLAGIGAGASGQVLWHDGTRWTNSAANPFQATNAALTALATTPAMFQATNSGLTSLGTSAASGRSYLGLSENATNAVNMTGGAATNLYSYRGTNIWFGSSGGLGGIDLLNISASDHYSIKSHIQGSGNPWPYIVDSSGNAVAFDTSGTWSGFAGNILTITNADNRYGVPSEFVRTGVVTQTTPAALRSAVHLSQGQFVNDPLAGVGMVAPQCVISNYVYGTRSVNYSTNLMGIWRWDPWTKESSVVSKMTLSYSDTRLYECGGNLFVNFAGGYPNLRKLTISGQTNKFYVGEAVRIATVSQGTIIGAPDTNTLYITSSYSWAGGESIDGSVSGFTATVASAGTLYSANGTYIAKADHNTVWLRGSWSGGVFFYGETVSQAVSGATAVFLGQRIIWYGQTWYVFGSPSGTFDLSHTVTGASSGTTFTPAEKLSDMMGIPRCVNLFAGGASTPATPGVDSQSGWANLGNGKLLMVAKNGDSPAVGGLWYSADGGDNWSELIHIVGGAAGTDGVRHLHSIYYWPASQMYDGVELLVVCTGDEEHSVADSSILICRNTADLIANPSTWRSNWGIDKVGATRNSWFAGAGAPYVIAYGSTLARTIPVVLGADAKSLYWVPDTTTDTGYLYKHDLSTGVRTAICRAPTEGWSSLTFTNKVSLFGSHSGYFGGAFGGSSPYISVNALDSMTGSFGCVTKFLRGDYDTGYTANSEFGFKDFYELADADGPFALLIPTIRGEGKHGDYAAPLEVNLPITLRQTVNGWAGSQIGYTERTVPSVVINGDGSSALSTEWTVAGGFAHSTNTVVDIEEGKSTSIYIEPTSTGITEIRQTFPTTPDFAARAIGKVVRFRMRYCSNGASWTSSQMCGVRVDPNASNVHDDVMRFYPKTTYSKWVTYEGRLWVNSRATAPVLSIIARVSGSGTNPLYVSGIKMWLE